VKKNVHIIFNPVAGAGKAARLKDWLTAQLDVRFEENYTWTETTRQGEAIQLTRKSIENGAQLLIAVGGDGTINEVVNGFFKNEKPIGPSCELGILNCGSGGGFAQSLGLPADISGQLDLIEKATAHSVDIGHATCAGEGGNLQERYFVNEFQIGIGADIVSKVGIKHKHFGGAVAFGTVTVSEMFHTKSVRMKTRLDAHEPQTNQLLGIVAGNGRYCAGGMQLTPGANHFDGLLDVLFIRKMNLLQRCLDFPKIYAGKHIFSKNFSLEQAGTIEIDSTPPVRVEADGELLGHTPCQIRIVPGAIRVRC
jgi:YegS/Rv2252/BmrU family lipid kinase